MPQFQSIYDHFGQRLTSMYKKDDFGRRLGTMSIREIFKSVKDRAKRKKVKHKTLYALGKAARMRILNGAELNTCLFGIPLLIDVGCSYIVEGHFIKGGFKGLRKKRKLKLQLKQNSGNGGKTTNRGEREPISMAPYSDKMRELRDRLIDSGVSTEGANEFVSGGHEDEDASDYLSEKDASIIVDKLDEIFETSDDSSDGDE